MEVSPPELSKYSDASGTVSLEIPYPQDHKKPRVIVVDKNSTAKDKNGESYLWQEVDLPSQVLISAESKTVILLGSLGDSGQDLGKIDIRSYSGDILKKIDLTKQITNLENASKNDPLNMGNFPWIDHAALTGKGQSLHIDVCGIKAVDISLKDFSIHITDIKK